LRCCKTMFWSAHSCMMQTLDHTMIQFLKAWKTGKFISNTREIFIRELKFPPTDSCAIWRIHVCPGVKNWLVHGRVSKGTLGRVCLSAASLLRRFVCWIPESIDLGSQQVAKSGAQKHPKNL
jgi:hypothetical protein